MTWPVEFTAKREEVRPVKARFVVVALVVVAFTVTRFVIVEVELFMSIALEVVGVR